LKKDRNMEEFVRNNISKIGNTEGAGYDFL
jgi:hypothetical protein